MSRATYQIGRTRISDFSRASFQLLTLSSLSIISQSSWTTIHCLLKLPILYSCIRVYHSTQGCWSEASHDAMNAGQDMGEVRLSPPIHRSFKSSASVRLFKIKPTSSSKFPGSSFKRFDGSKSRLRYEMRELGTGRSRSLCFPVPRSEIALS